MARVKKNEYRIEGDICYIDCFGIKGVKTGTIIIDAEDIPKVNTFSWHIEHSRKTIDYAQAMNGATTIRMHRILCHSNEQVDHINHNGLDNRKSNLRACSNRDNNHNKECSFNPKSGYKGVRYNPRAKSYYARINIDGKDISLGAYKDPLDAVRAREEAEEKYYGEFKFRK